MAGRPRWWVAGLSLFLALVVGLVVWLTQRDSTYHAPLERPRRRAQASPAQAADAPARPGDRRRPRRPGRRRRGSGPPPRRRTALAGVVRNGQALHVTGFSLRYVDEAGGVAPDGAFAAYVAGLLALRRLRPARRDAWRSGSASPSADGHLAHRRHRRGRPAVAAVAVGPGPGTPLARHAGRSSQGDAAEADRVAALAAHAPSRRCAGCCRAGAGTWSWRCPATEQRLERAPRTPTRASTPASRR